MFGNQKLKSDPLPAPAQSKAVVIFNTVFDVLVKGLGVDAAVVAVMAQAPTWIPAFLLPLLKDLVVWFVNQFAAFVDQTIRAYVDNKLIEFENAEANKQYQNTINDMKKVIADPKADDAAKKAAVDAARKAIDDLVHKQNLERLKAEREQKDLIEMMKRVAQDPRVEIMMSRDLEHVSLGMPSLKSEDLHVFPRPEAAPEVEGPSAPAVVVKEPINPIASESDQKSMEAYRARLNEEVARACSIPAHLLHPGVRDDSSEGGGT